MFTRATVPFGLPQAPRIPVCSLSAPAHDNILLIRTTWYGWARTRRWKPSLPATLTRYLCRPVRLVIKNKAMDPAYLLAQIRAASRASEDNCSYSLETMWTQRGNSSTLARLRPRSKIRILGSGTPRLKRDFGYGCRREKLAAVLRVFTACLRQNMALWSKFEGGGGFVGALMSLTYLVFAVSITSRWASCHLDIILKGGALLANGV